MVLGLFLAYLSRAHGWVDSTTGLELRDRLVLLKRPAGYLWLGGMLSALPTFALRIPRIGKFVCLFIVVILGVPALLVAGSIYVLDDGKPSTTSKPKDKSEGTPRDEVEADETSKESKKTK